MMETLYALIMIVNGQFYVVDQHLTWADCHPKEAWKSVVKVECWEEVDKDRPTS